MGALEACATGSSTSPRSSFTGAAESEKAKHASSNNRILMNDSYFLMSPNGPRLIREIRLVSTRGSTSLLAQSR